MTVEEARKVLAERRESRGRPPREWTERKREAERIVRAHSAISVKVSTSSMMVEVKVMPEPEIKTEPDPRSQEVSSYLASIASTTDW